MADETPAAPVALARLVEDSAVEGLNGGIILFFRKRGLDLTESKAEVFAKAITAEFGPESEHILYPLSKSIAEPVKAALADSAGVFDLLYKAGEHDNLRKLVRVIVSGEMLNVMQDRLEEVIKFHQELK